MHAYDARTGRRQMNLDGTAGATDRATAQGEPSPGRQTRRQRRAAERRANQARRGAGFASVLVLALTIGTVSSGLAARDTATARARVEASVEAEIQLTASTRRADAAAASRLGAAGRAFATRVRVEALVAARTSRADAGEVRDTADAVPDVPGLAALDEARRTLDALTAGLAPRAGATAVITVSFVGRGPSAPAADAVGASSGPGSASPVLDSDATSVSRSMAIIRAARDLDARAVQVRAATSAAIAEREQRAAKAAAAAAADLARRVTTAQQAPNGRIPLEVLCGVTFAPDVHLRCDAASALDALDAAYHASHHGHLVVVSSYRDLADQVEVKATRGDLASTPGASNHGRGVAIDLAGLGAVDDFAEPTYLWLKAHAAAYGWTHPAAMEPGGDGPAEPWHWEFGTA